MCAHVQVRRATSLDCKKYSNQMIMKKQYFKPKSRLVDVELDEVLLTGSPEISGPGGAGGGYNPDEGDFGDDEEEEARYNDFYFD